MGVAEAVIETMREVQTAQVEGLALQAPERDTSYLEFVRSRQCIVCAAAPPSQPHHTERGGVALKGSDLFCLPVCASCHREIHDTGQAAYWDDHNVWEYIARTLAAFVTVNPAR